MATPAPKGFASLPQELIDQICHDVNNDWNDWRNRGRLGDLNNLSRTCWRLLHGVLPILYHRGYLYKGQSCLWWACGAGRTSTVQRAISTGYATCELGHLLSAIRRKHLDIVRLLVEVPSVLQAWQKDPDPHFDPSDRETPLSAAALSGDLDLVRIVLAKNPMDRALRKDSNRTLEHSALHIAVSRGYIEMATLFLSHRAPVDALASQDGPDFFELRSPLHRIADTKERADFAMIKLLVDHGANVNLKDKSGRTPLHCALERDNFHNVRILLEAGAKLPEKALTYAAKSSNAKMLRILMEHGADVSDVDLLHTPLVIAAASSNFDGLQLLLELGADPNGRNEYDRRIPLHVAIQVGSAACVKLLLDAGADVNASTKHGAMPLHTLLSNSEHKSKAEILSMLFSAGADPNKRNRGTGWTALHRIIQILEDDDRPVLRMVQTVLETGAEVDALHGVPLYRHESDDDTIITAFEYLTQVTCRRIEHRRTTELVEDEIAVLRLLLDYGADPDRNRDVCPFSCALRYGNSRVLDLLVSHGVEFQVEDGAHLEHIHHTRPHYLTNPRNLYNDEVNAWLLQKGLDENARDATSGRTLFHTICTNDDGFPQRIRTLLARPFQVTVLDAQDSEGNTALHLAVMEKKDDLVRALLKGKAKLELVNHDGKTALDIAQRMQDQHLIRSIEQVMERRAKYPNGSPPPYRPGKWDSPVFYGEARIYQPFSPLPLRR